MKIIPFVFVGLLVFSSIGSFAQTAEDNKLKVDFITCSDPEIIEEKECSYVTLEEADNFLNNPGQPCLPVITETYTFAVGTIISSVSCEPKSIEQQMVSKEIAYCPAILPRNSINNQIKENVKDMKVYSSSDFYPNSWYDYSINVGRNGEDIVTFLTVKYYPVRYSPQNNKILTSTDAKISVEYELASQQTKSDKYDLVIISPLIFKPFIRKLVNHKEEMGIKTKSISTEHIYLNYEGRDKAEKIKYAIKEAHDDFGIKYVLLFGGMKNQNFWSWHVPVRYSNLDDASNIDLPTLDESSFLSDLYFSDIYKYNSTTGYSFDSWDSNNNGVFAEWNQENKDILDLHPDVYVGRLACRNIFEVRNVIDKIIAYESKTYGQEWFNKMAVAGGDSFNDSDFDNSTDYLEGQVENEHALSFMDGFEGIRMWVEGGDVGLTTENITNTLNQGQGFVHFSGHGNPGSWSTHPRGDEGTWIDFKNKDIKNLRNGEELPILIVESCHACQFDVSFLRVFEKYAIMWGEIVPRCWGWQFVSNSKGGSIATIGNTGLGYGTTGDGPEIPDEIPDSIPDGIPDCIQYLGGWIGPHFFEVYNQENVDILGEAHGETIIDYLQEFPINWDENWEDYENTATLLDVKTAQQWILLGDPSLKIGGYE